VTHPAEVWWIAVIESFLVVNLVMVAFAYTTWLERKALGRMQLRYGPNRAGPFGLLQPIADLIKLVRKEAFYPGSAVELPYIVAPVISCATALLAFSVIPFGPGWTIGGYYVNGAVAILPISLILIFALGSIGVYGFIVGGWASDSKYSLLGSMRTCAQLVSYEVSLALAVIGVVMMGRSLNLVEIVDRQASTLWFFIPQIVGLCVFMLAGIAETSRPPFDLPEADTELVAGYHTEYSGMRWGLFQTAEYINMIVLSGLAVTLFFGGWHFPFVSSLDSWGPVWFLIKLGILVNVFIWLRASQPRLRYDQLMKFGWKILLPIATVNAVVTAALVVAVK
jgi:NADH-quinone oxidoreductase subunit H